MTGVCKCCEKYAVKEGESICKKCWMAGHITKCGCCNGEYGTCAGTDKVPSESAGDGEGGAEKLMVGDPLCPCGCGGWYGACVRHTEMLPASHLVPDVCTPYTNILLDRLVDDIWLACESCRRKLDVRMTTDPQGLQVAHYMKPAPSTYYAGVCLAVDEWRAAEKAGFDPLVVWERVAARSMPKLNWKSRRENAYEANLGDTDFRLYGAFIEWAGSAHADGIEVVSFDGDDVALETFESAERYLLDSYFAWLFLRNKELRAALRP